MSAAPDVVVVRHGLVAGGVSITYHSGGAHSVMVERYARPKTFNGLRIKPAYGKGAAKIMAGRAAELSREIDEWCTWAAELPLIDDAIFRGEVAVTVGQGRINRAAMPDTGAPYIAAKAVVDGLTLAGYLPNGDGPEVVRSLTFQAPEVVGLDALRVTLTAIPSTQQGVLDFTEGTATP